jgi:hypothetical protein
VLVTLAGAAGYFNYCYAQASLPSAETLHNFADPRTKTWPARSHQPWKLDASRNAAIWFGVLSVLFFFTACTGYCTPRSVDWEAADAFEPTAYAQTPVKRETEEDWGK